MAKEFLVEGAICQCKLGTTPGKLAVLDNTQFKINGGKLAGTTLSLGNTFDPPGFGACRVNPTFPKPCVPAITQWAKPYTGIKTSAGGNPLTEESTATCGSGLPECITVIQTGQIPVPGIVDFQKASSEHQADLDPMGDPAALTEHQIPFAPTTRFDFFSSEPDPDIEVESIIIVTPLDKGSANKGGVARKETKLGLAYDKTYELEVSKFKKNRKPSHYTQIHWEYSFEDDNGVTVTGIIFQRYGNKAYLMVGNRNMLGKEVTIRAYVNSKDAGAEVKIWVHYAFRHFDAKVIESQAQERASKPWLVDQGNTPLCGMAAIFYLFASQDPSGYVSFVNELHHKGQAHYNGYKVEPFKGKYNILGDQRDSSKIMYDMDPQDKKDYPYMPEVDWLTLATLRSNESKHTNALFGKLVYSGKEEKKDIEQLLAVNWPPMMERLCKKFLKYKSVESTDMDYASMTLKKGGPLAKWNDKNSHYDQTLLLQMEQAYQEGHKIIMLIDSKMLDDKTSYNVGDLFKNMHYIVYEGGLEFYDANGGRTDDFDKVVKLKFRFFTWGYDPVTKQDKMGSYHYYYFMKLGSKISIECFKSTFLGYIKCRNDNPINIPLPTK